MHSSFSVCIKQTFWESLWEEIAHFYSCMADFFCPEENLFENEAVEQQQRNIFINIRKRRMEREMERKEEEEEEREEETETEEEEEKEEEIQDEYYLINFKDE